MGGGWRYTLCGCSAFVRIVLRKHYFACVFQRQAMDADRRDSWQALCMRWWMAALVGDASANPPAFLQNVDPAAAVCYWCRHQTWEHEGWRFVDDWPLPLCPRCFEWYADGWMPYEPHARTRSSRRLQWFFPTLPAAVTETVASFLRAWREP